MMRRLALVVVLVGLVGGAACGGNRATTGEGTTSEGATKKVTVMLDWTPNTNHAGIYLAQAQGWYRDAGLDVEIIQPGETGSVQALGAGNVDFAVSVQEEILPARANGVPVVSIAGIIAHNTSSLVALGSEGITRPRDLAGKRYGGFGGQLERALVTALVACDGGDPEAVEFVEVGNVDYAVGLTRNQFDFIWAFDAWDVIRLRDREALDVVRIPFADHLACIPDWYTPLLATNEELIEASPATVQAFVGATRRGYQEAMASPETAAATLLAAVPELDGELVERSAAHLAGLYAEDPGRWGLQDVEVWRRFAEFLSGAGLVEDEVEVDAAFTNRFLTG